RRELGGLRHKRTVGTIRDRCRQDDRQLEQRGDPGECHHVGAQLRDSDVLDRLKEAGLMVEQEERESSAFIRALPPALGRTCGMRLLLSSSVSDFQHDNADGHLAQPLASSSDQPPLTGGATSDSADDNALKHPGKTPGSAGRERGGQPKVPCADKSFLARLTFAPMSDLDLRPAKWSSEVSLRRSNP